MNLQFTMNLPDNETRQHILDVAEEAFSTHGYNATRLRDIAFKVGMKHASLYYYVPGGKEQLFVEVMERNLERHRDGMTRALQGAGPELRSQMRAIIEWLLSQPPLDLVRMQQTDMPAIAPEQARRLVWMAYDALRLPLRDALAKARTRGEVGIRDLDTAVMAFIALIESIHGIPLEHVSMSREQIAADMVDMLLDGWRIRGA